MFSVLSVNKKVCYITNKFRMREKTRGNFYDIVSFRVSDVGSLVKNLTDKDKERQISFSFGVFLACSSLCALSHENQKQCHVFCLRMTQVLVEV